MFFAGPGFVCTGDAEKETYDGTMFRPSDMKHVTQNFYKTKRRHERAKKNHKGAQALPTPTIFELGWAHPSNDTRTGRIGEHRDTYVDDMKRQIVIGRINAATLKGKEIIQSLKDDEPVGISFDTVFKQMGEGKSSKIVAKSVTGVSLVNRPAHHKTGTYIEHYAATEEELFRKLFPDAGTGVIGVEGLAAEGRKRPFFVPKALRSRMQAVAKIRIPPNDVKAGPEDEDEEEEEEGDEKDDKGTEAAADDAADTTNEAEKVAEGEKTTKYGMADENETEKAAAFDEDAMDVDQAAEDTKTKKTTTTSKEQAPEKNDAAKKKEDAADLPNDPMEEEKKPASSVKRGAAAAAEGEAIFDASSVSNNDKSSASRSSLATDAATDTTPKSTKKAAPKMSVNSSSSSTTNKTFAPAGKQQVPLTKKPAAAPQPPADDDNAEEDLIEQGGQGEEDEEQQPDHEEGEDDAMDTTPPPPMPISKPSLKRPLEGKQQPNQKSVKTNKEANAAYKMSSEDVKQQLESTMETTKEYFDMLGMNTPEQRDAFIQAQLAKKAKKAIAEQRQAAMVVENLIAETAADDDTKSTFNSMTQDMINGKHGPEFAQYAKVLAAAAASHGSDAPSHLAVEGEYQRQKKAGTDSAAQKNANKGTRNIEAKAGVSFNTNPGGNPSSFNVNGGRWGNDFFSNTFSSRSVTNGGNAIRKGAGFRSSDDHFRSAPQERSLPAGFIAPSIKKRGSSGHPRVSGYEDAMDIDDQIGAGDNSDGGDLQQRIDMMQTPDIGFKFVGKKSAKSFVSSLPKEISTYKPDSFDFERLQSNMKENGYFHHVATALLYPDRKMGVNPGMRDTFTDQSSFYNQADTPSGYVPRIIRGGKAIIVADNDNE